MNHRSALAVSLCLSLAALAPAQVAPGTETLVPFAGLVSGSGMAVGGTGMIVQPGVLALEVPAGSTVKQVLALWAGQSNSLAGDDEILLDGQRVRGVRVGGPAEFFQTAGKTFYTHTYRADVTGLGLIQAGGNSVVVSGMDFDAMFAANKGAALVAVYDDGSSATLQLREGTDNSFGGFTGARKTTVPQVFEFAASTDARKASLDLIVAAVLEGDESVVLLRIDNGAPTVLENLFKSEDGLEFDTRTLSVDIPAGATRLSVQIESRNVVHTEGALASVTWVGAAFGLDRASGQQCFEHLGAKFWASHTELWGPTGLKPTDKVGEVFDLRLRGSRYCGYWGWRRVRGVDPSTTLADALARRGGGDRCGYNRGLLSVGVAALLNARHPAVRYPIHSSTIVCTVRAGLIHPWFWLARHATRVLCYHNWRTSLCIR